MPVNPYFNQVTFTNEQALLDSLIIEAIQIHGHNVWYIPREVANLDRLFGEDTLAHYDLGVQIELYLKSNMQYAGPGPNFGKFGYVIEDDVTFLLSRTRFDQELGLNATAKLARPRENDLIYIEWQAAVPVRQMIYEIRFVQDTEQLFQLGKLYTYELRCQSMNYSHERINTTVANLNSQTTGQSFTVDLQFANGVGTYLDAETVYQGSNFLSATATGQVATWDANTLVLGVQNITGAFNTTNVVIGVSSNATYHPTGSIDLDTLPTDAFADNSLLDTAAPGVVQPILNPRFS
jgi:hypothetical protein